MTDYPSADISDDSDISDVLTDASGDNVDVKSSPIKRFLNSQTKRKHSQDSQNDLFKLSPKKLDFENSKKELFGVTKVPIKKLKTEKIVNVDKVENKDAFLNEQKHPDSWVNECKPSEINELCIHKKKLENLQQEIEDLIYKRTNNRILVVSGPCGSGKSTTVNLIAEKIMKEKILKIRKLMIGSEISDNINNDDLKFTIEFNISKDSHFGNSSVYYFKEFLNQCKMLTGLNEKCIIIEELPNLFHRETHQDFQNSLLNWINMDSNFQLPPLIICLTEFDIDNDLNYNNGTNFTIDNTFKVETVLGFKLMQFENSGWKRIRFNKVAKTFLKKAILRVCKIKNVKPNKIIDLEIDRLSTLKDLRNAINTFEFWYRFQYNKGKNDDDNNDYHESILGKETGLDIFHAIGKIIYGTKHQIEEFDDFKKRHNLKININQINNKNIITVDNISSEIMSHLSRFNLCCLENYSVINPPVNINLNKFMEILCISDNLIHRSEDFNNPNILSSTSFLSCFGLRIICEDLKSQSKIDVNNGINNKKIIFSRDSKLLKKLVTVNNEIKEFQKRREKRMILNNNYSYLSKFNITLIDGFYQNNFFTSFKFRYKMFQETGKSLKLKDQRIGGKFTNSLTADDNFLTDKTDEEDYINYNNKGIYSSDKIKDLEDEYFGVPFEGAADNIDDDDEVIAGGEFESDPIEDSEEENKATEAEDKNNDLCDEFSDDSEVLAEFF
jgi:energy-coupling factor transporter ATP-binding protein EcfA2